jgi:hypothetical protein
MLAAALFTSSILFDIKEASYTNRGCTCPSHLLAVVILNIMRTKALYLEIRLNPTGKVMSSQDWMI